jgi:hypothetical protein
MCPGPASASADRLNEPKRPLWTVADIAALFRAEDDLALQPSSLKPTMGIRHFLKGDPLGHAWLDLAFA